MFFLRIFLSDKKALLHAVILYNELQCVGLFYYYFEKIRECFAIINKDDTDFQLNISTIFRKNA